MKRSWIILSEWPELLEKSKGKLQEVDAYLDSATLLCEKRKIDCPSSLHLLKAEYFFQSGDYSSAEEQGNLALEKSEGSKEYEVQARTLNFLGRYYQRTGFFKESIESFNAGIDLAQKHKLKGIIPMSYRGQANVYNAAEDLNNYRKNLRLMADAGYAEGDTMAVMDDYCCLVRHLLIPTHSESRFYWEMRRTCPDQGQYFYAALHLQI